ncbi:TPA: hypothetical protein N0F65_005557 [Lagenidium giganteum]|uniref:Protein kinase domain-containing protein n=1 Tax=Lagenidium giganteum TaxID=4803 RepID=A0AAV2YUA2_9STRA|nr:TPA: hypothetical protein N0F65_005557 [Lagenidium giganteum]
MILIAAAVFVVCVTAAACIVFCKFRRGPRDSGEDDVDIISPKVTRTQTNPSTASGAYYSARSVPGIIDSSVAVPTWEGQLVQSLNADQELVNGRIDPTMLQYETVMTVGAFEIWKCCYNDTTVVSAKMLLPQNRHSMHEVNLFVEEIKLSLSLSHPNIVYFLGVTWTSLDDLCLVMEYHERGDLQTILQHQGNKLTWSNDKLHIALGLARALMYLHGRPSQILHRDIKAKNVLVTNSFVAKLGEFGGSRHQVDATMTGGPGAAFWAAPEVLQGLQYSEKADMYSFGVLLNELDTCTVPFQSYRSTMQPIEIIRHIMGGSLQLHFSPSCPPRVFTIAQACLAVPAEERPRAHEVVTQLEQILWRT